MVRLLEAVRIDMSFLKTNTTETLCYVGNNGEETKFFQLLNVFCWKNHPVQNPNMLVDLITIGVK
jgi:hypothetical protein